MVTWREASEIKEKERCEKDGHSFQAEIFGYRWCGMCGIMEIIVHAEDDDEVKYEDGMLVYNGRAIRPKLVFEPLKNRYER